MTQQSTIDSFRPLSLEETEQALREWKQYFIWKEVLDFARSVFGESVYDVALDYQSDYDDEATYYYVHRIEVYNQEWEKLSYDLTAPFWHKRDSYTQKTPLDELDRLLREELGEQEVAGLTAEALQRLRMQVASDNGYIPDMRSNLTRLHRYISENSYYGSREHFTLGDPPHLTYPELYCRI